jgi:hypothetical protein
MGSERRHDHHPAVTPRIAKNRIVAVAVQTCGCGCDISLCEEQAVSSNNSGRDARTYKHLRCSVVEKHVTAECGLAMSNTVSGLG